MSDVLLLNSGGSVLSIVPLSIIRWQYAVKLLFQEKISPVEWYDNWPIRSPTVEIKLPAIAMLKKFHNSKGEIQFNKYNVLLRDNYRCAYCGKFGTPTELTLDHVIPKSLGGKKNWTNTIACCGFCNRKKGNKFIKPSHMPFKPTVHDLVKNRRQYPITIKHDSWQDYLQWDEDLINWEEVDEPYFIAENNDWLNNANYN